MESSPPFPVGPFDVPATTGSPPSNNHVAHIANNPCQQPNSRYRSRESRPRSPSGLDSTYSRRSSLPTISSGSSEANSYFAQHAIAYNSITGPLTSSSNLSFTPSLLWRPDSIVSRNAFRNTRSTSTSSSNPSSIRSKHSSMWGTSDTDGSRRSGLRSFLSLDSAPRISSDTSEGQRGPILNAGYSTGILAFAQAGEVFNNSNQRGRAVFVDNASSAARVPPCSLFVTNRDDCITMDVRTLQDIPETSTGLLFDSESFNDSCSAEESGWYRAPELSTSSRKQLPGASADSPVMTFKPISPILPSPATPRPGGRPPSVATYTTTTTMRSTIKRARRDEALARLEGKFYEAPPMEDNKIKSFMGFDDDDDSEDGDRTDNSGSGHLDVLSIGLDLQSLPLPMKRESSLAASPSASLESTSSSSQAGSLAIESSAGSSGISLHNPPSLPQATLSTQKPKTRTREIVKDMRVQIRSPRSVVLSSQPSPGSPLPSSSGTPPPTSATTISSRNASPSSLSSFTPIFDEPPRPRPGKRHKREMVRKDKGFPNATGSLENLFSTGAQTGDSKSPRLNRFEFETWLELDGDDSGVDGTSQKSLI